MDMSWKSAGKPAKKGDGHNPRQSEQAQKVYDVNKRMRDLRFRHGPSMNRGYILIIINYRFPGRIEDLPKGNDIQAIKEIFSKYGYEINSFTNLSPDRILQKVKLFASMGNSKSFVCFISSHGNSTSLLGADGKELRIKDMFEAANTKELEGKPKTFFIDACRSLRLEEIPDSHLPDLPAECFFVGFSCLASQSSAPGNKSCGAYFEALITVFRDSFRFPPTERNKRRDINYLVQKANNLVREKTGQQPEIRSSMAGEYFLQGEKE